MFKNIALAVSLLLNGIVAYWAFFPTQSNAARMTCAEASSETLNKQATLKFSIENSGSLAATHDFLRASDYGLRNIASVNGQLTFVYTAKSYPQSCGFHLPGLDGNIVRIRTDLLVPPTIVDVN
jgi:hypothetical protein